MSPPAAPLLVRRRRRVIWATAVVVVVAVAAVAVWYAGSPAQLPTTEQPIEASTPAGVPIYVGVFVPPADFGRAVHVSGVKVHATSGAPLTVSPLLCRGGAVRVTSDPGPFCEELVDPEGAELGAGDSIVLEVRGDTPTDAVVDRVRVAYRDGLQWDTQEAGAPATVTILP